MKYIDFEKHIKKELGNSKETVQMDALLASLNLGEKPKRKGIALWILLPFLLLVISGFAWNFMGVNSSNKSDSPDFSNALMTGKVSKQENINQQNSISESNLNSENNLAISDLVEKDENITDETVGTDKTNRILNSVSTTSSSIDDKTSISYSSNTNILSANKITESTHSQHSIQNDFKDVLENASPNSSLKEQSETIISTESGQKNTTAAEDISRISRDMISITKLENSIDGLEDNEMDGKLFSRMKINCPSFDNAGWHMALIPEVGVFLPIKTLEKNVLEESAAFNERLNSETTLEGLEIGLYGMVVRDNIPFYLKAGISYSRISERMDLKYEYTEIDTTYGIISSTVSSNGDTITDIYGDIFSEITYKGSNRQHYYVHLFDIPIAVGYTTYIAGLDVGIEAGVKVNFMTKATGNLLTSQKDYTNLSLNRMYKNRVGFSYFGGLMIGRNFGRFGDIYIAPRFTYYPNEFNNENNNVSQKYLSVGLNAGIVYKIN